MATLVSPSLQPGGPPVGSRVGTAPVGDRPDVITHQPERPATMPEAAALPGGRGALVPVMEDGPEPAERRPDIAIHVSETDARWWFG